MMNLVYFLYALALGALVNYLADVLPTRRRLARPACPTGEHDLGLADYLLARPCPQCGKTRGPRPWIVLGLALLGAAFLVFGPQQKMGFWLASLTLAYFGLIVVIDLEHRLILHVTTLGGAALGFAVGAVTRGWQSALIGGLSNLAIMFILYLLGVAFARYRARKLGVEDDEEALGFGDVTLAGVLGLMLAWPLSVFSLVYGILIAGVFSLLLIGFLVATRRFQSMNIYTAYGPYLIAGAFLLLFFPDFALKLLR